MKCPVCNHEYKTMEEVKDCLTAHIKEEKIAEMEKKRALREEEEARKREAEEKKAIQKAKDYDQICKKYNELLKEIDVYNKTYSEPYREQLTLIRSPKLSYKKSVTKSDSNDDYDSLIKLLKDSFDKFVF